MQKEYIVNFSFKGARDYVHGTDIIQSFLHLNLDFQTISFKFLRPLRSNASWCLSDSSDLATCHSLAEHAAVSGKFLNSDKLDIAFFLIPEQTSSISFRYDYDETSVNSSLKQSNEKSFEITFDNRYSWIEYIVSAMKFACTPFSKTPLRLASLSILDPISLINASCCQLKLEKILAGKYFKSGIYIASDSDVPLGKIEFLSL